MKIENLRFHINKIGEFQTPPLLTFFLWWLIIGTEDKKDFRKTRQIFKEIGQHCSTTYIILFQNRPTDLLYTTSDSRYRNNHKTPLSTGLRLTIHKKIEARIFSTLYPIYKSEQIRRTLKACPPELRETAYFSLDRSSLEYSSAVWYPFRQKYINKLETMQRSAARFVTQNYRQTSNLSDISHSEPGLN